MLKKILIGLVALVAILTIVVVLQPSHYHVERTAEIEATVNAVWPEISNFNQWEAWNPWSAEDPEQKTTVSGTPGAIGHKSAWIGEKTGEGSMTIVNIQQPNQNGVGQIDIKLDFIKPMQSQADSAFKVEAKGESTQVTWTMDGENDFMGKFFGLIMGIEDMIGAKYEQGLANLKGVVEGKRLPPI